MINEKDQVMYMRLFTFSSLLIIPPDNNLLQNFKQPTHTHTYISDVYTNTIYNQMSQNEKGAGAALNRRCVPLPTGPLAALELRRSIMLQSGSLRCCSHKSGNDTPVKVIIHFEMKSYRHGDRSCTCRLKGASQGNN